MRSACPVSESLVSSQTDFQCAPAHGRPSRVHQGSAIRLLVLHSLGRCHSAVTGLSGFRKSAQKGTKNSALTGGAYKTPVFIGDFEDCALLCALLPTANQTQGFNENVAFVTFLSEKRGVPHRMPDSKGFHRIVTFFSDIFPARTFSPPEYLILNPESCRQAAPARAPGNLRKRCKNVQKGEFWCIEKSDERDPPVC